MVKQNSNHFLINDKLNSEVIICILTQGDRLVFVFLFTTITSHDLVFQLLLTIMFKHLWKKAILIVIIKTSKLNKK